MSNKINEGYSDTRVCHQLTHCCDKALFPNRSDPVWCARWSKERSCVARRDGIAATCCAGVAAVFSHPRGSGSRPVPLPEARVLTARQHFTDPQIQDLATTIYERVDWPWMLNGSRTLSMGWKPESGFLEARWDHYCELMMLYLLAYGSPSHPLNPTTWDASSDLPIPINGITYISSDAPLFTHQYSHAWYDFRQKRDAYADYFDNSVNATEAHKRFCLSMRGTYPSYSEDLWGITASDSQQGYTCAPQKFYPHPSGRGTPQRR